jgi:hypothetical protein
MTLFVGLVTIFSALQELPSWPSPLGSTPSATLLLSAGLTQKCRAVSRAPYWPDGHRTEDWSLTCKRSLRTSWNELKA